MDNEQLMAKHSETVDEQQEGMASEDNTRLAFSKDDILFGEYRIICPLGSGSQAIVYKAERISDDTPVAIKLRSLKSLKSWKEYDLFMREGEILKSLDIPGVAHVCDAGVHTRKSGTGEDNILYIVQEYVEGKTIAEWLKEGFHFSVAQFCDIVLRLLRTLEALHHRMPPVVHRDIKPSNIMVSFAGDEVTGVSLIDFGVVSNPMVDQGGSTVAGTFGYMAPEQLMGQCSPESDIYSLAATIVEILSGKSPDKMDYVDFKLVIEPHLPNISPDLIRVLNQMLEPDAAKRLCDHGVLRNVFLQYQSTEGKSVGLVQPQINVEQFCHDLLAYRFPGQSNMVEIWRRLPDRVPRDFKAVLSEVTNGYVEQKSLFTITDVFLGVGMLLVIIIVSIVRPSRFLLFVIGACIFGYLAVKYREAWMMEKNVKTVVRTKDNASKDTPSVLSNQDYYGSVGILKSSPAFQLINKGKKLVAHVDRIECYFISEKIEKIQTKNFVQEFVTDNEDFSLMNCLSDEQREMYHQLVNMKYRSGGNDKDAEERAVMSQTVLFRDGRLEKIRQASEQYLVPSKETVGGRDLLYTDQLKPVFRILYSFILDGESYSASIITEISPVFRLKPGDALPILYYLGFCMPYPWPVRELAESIEMIDFATRKTKAKI